MTPLRVLYVNHAGLVSGAEIVLARVTGRLDPARFRRIALCPADGRLAAFWADAMDEVLPLPMTTEPVPPLPRAWEVVRSASAVRRAIREKRIDLVHANSPRACLVAGPAARLAGVPLVWHMHDIPKDRAAGRAAIRAASRLASAIVGVSFATCRALVALGAQERKVRRIHNGMDVGEYVARAAERAAGFPIAEGAPVVAMIGQVTPWKGTDVLVAAIPKVLEAVPEARFVVVGDSPFPVSEKYRADLERRTREAPWAARVTWLRFREDVPAILARADVVVHASVLPDPLPTVVLEAMALGRAVVASRVGGVPEMVDDGVTGTTYPPGDARALAEAIATILGDPGTARRLGDSAALKVREHFPIARQVAEILDLYRLLTPGHPAWNA
jgi:glycosyltransferase involved in cell wall biosynthesis